MHDSDLPKTKGVQTIETCVRDCAIESVVVYTDRAEVRRTVPVTLAAGENTVIVYGLSSCVDKNSIRLVMFNVNAGSTLEVFEEIRPCNKLGIAYFLSFLSSQLSCFLCDPNWQRVVWCNHALTHPFTMGVWLSLTSSWLWTDSVVDHTFQNEIGRVQ